MNSTRTPRSWGLARLLALSLPAFAATAAFAQDTAGSTDDTVKLEKFIVTGSNIPMAGDTKSVPVTVIGQSDIEKSGLNANLLEVLQKRMPMLSGNGNLGTTSANTGSGATGGGSNASLRNLATLVLINGRRVSDNGIGGNGGRNFVDVSQIPVAAIERVEVLTDGASAIYGSDAIGGVINVILRSNYRGAEVGGRYGFSSAEGDYTEKSAYVVAGAATDKVGVTVSGSWSKVDPLLQSDRAVSRPIVGRTATYSGVVGQGTAFPTAMLANGVNSPRDRNPVGPNATAPDLAALIANGTYVPATFASAAALLDIAPYVTLIIERESKAAYANFDAQLVGKQIQFFGDLLYTENNSMSQLAAQPSTPNLTLPAGSPYNPLTVAFPQVAFRYLPAPRIFENEAKLTRYTAGFRGEIGGDWNWEAAYTYNRNQLTRLTHNVLYAPNMNRAVAGGFNSAGVATPGGTFSRVVTGYSESGSFVTQPALDALARSSAVDPASLANILGTSRGDFLSSNRQLDARVSGVLYELPADKLRFAIGASSIQESLTGIPDANSRQTGPTARQWLGATFFDPFTQKRSISAGFAEVRVPIAGEGWNAPGLHRLELDAAYRSERYSDAGRSNVPKYGLVYQPVDSDLTFRYSYSKSFVAPTLYALFGPTTQGFTNNAIIPGVFGVNGQAQQQTGSDPTLRPSTAKTHSFGFAWSPKQVKGLTVSMDYLHVNQLDLVGTLGAGAILQDVNALGAASVFAPQVSFVNFPGTATAVPITAPGQLAAFLAAGNSANGIFVSDTNRNIAGQKVRALDLNIDYAFRSDTWGNWDFSTTGTFFLSYKFQATPFQAYYQFAGHTTNAGVSAQGTIPGYRFYTTATWRKGDWGVTLGHTYIPEVVDIGPGGLTFLTSTVLTRQPVDAYHSVDAVVNYTVPEKRMQSMLGWLKGMRLSVGVNNAFDEQPPLAPQAWNDNNADISTYNPIGRLWYFSASVKY